jgi:4-carboxymuconolactone decarboxylase
MKKTFFVLFISFFTTTMVCVISGGNIMADDRFDRGLKKLEEIDGAAGRNVIQSLQDISPDLARYTIEYPFGDIYMRPGLDLRTREIATIAALTALGNAAP